MQGKLIKNDYQKVMSSIKQQNISEQRARARKKREENKQNNGQGNQPVYGGNDTNVRKKPTEHISKKKANDHNTTSNGVNKKDGGTISKKPKASEQEQSKKPNSNIKKKKIKKSRKNLNKNKTAMIAQAIKIQIIITILNLNHEVEMIPLMKVQEVNHQLIEKTAEQLRKNRRQYQIKKQKVQTLNNLGTIAVLKID
ncbi:hypothetical protein H5U44_14540 (plasmid) [Staphylococcus aureus]|nr:hypothetical protein [Staphylococcus aureus]ULX29152.1 hypothetical protein H5U44_14540 [Staphylococcus aureus]